MTSEIYYAVYARFDTKSKKDAAVLLGSNCIVGDVFDIKFKMGSDGTKAWILNKYGAEVGFLDSETSHKLNVLSVKGFEICAVLSFVAFSENPESGHYWGQFAVFAFDKKYKSVFENFVNGCAEKIAGGVRPKINLEAQAVQKVLNSNGTWQPSGRVGFPKFDKHTAMIKKTRSFLDSMVKMGRQKKIGCYLVSWAFLLVLVALVLFALKSCGAF